MDYHGSMKTISASELRSKTSSLVRALENGRAVGLTYRGHKLAHIVPVRRVNGISAEDPLYQLHKHADRRASPLDDRTMDRMIYGG
jgi:antitoxin (DNA-binding transcriptional repressor) of toxin-antitoxin stability system